MNYRIVSRLSQPRVLYKLLKYSHLPIKLISGLLTPHMQRKSLLTITYLPAAKQHLMQEKRESKCKTENPQIETRSSLSIYPCGCLEKMVSMAILLPALEA
ncbi:hypothetical protein Fot_05656 [Forsythia ovata]|uniref:Uncharacterized protein n=1 Tax=Forsythia ovata TaxID=205694 RepID=A0ABD1WQR7_9LAMI